MIEYLQTRCSFNRAYDRWNQKHLYVKMLELLEVDTSRERKDLKQLSNITKLLFRATMIRQGRFMDYQKSFKVFFH